jgi:RHS repeat-associated protein
LGNIRVTIDDDTSVVGYNDYYPFGKQMPERCMNYSYTQDIYKFSGKELDEEYGLDIIMEFTPLNSGGARYYDPAIGRFLTVDPHADSYPSLTPYHYVGNRPISFIDLFGLDTFRVDINSRNIDRTVVENSVNHTYIIYNAEGIIATHTLAINDAGLVQFPESGNGFGRYPDQPDKGGDHYLKPEVAAALFGLTEEMRRIEQQNILSPLSNFRVDFGDMSNAQGGAPPGGHKTHGGPKGGSGDCIDFRYLNHNNQSEWGFATGAQFSWMRNFNFLNYASFWNFKSLVSNKPNVWVRGGIEFLPENAKKIKDHNDHGHLQYIR